MVGKPLAVGPAPQPETTPAEPAEKPVDEAAKPPAKPPAPAPAPEEPKSAEPENPEPEQPKAAPEKPAKPAKPAEPEPDANGRKATKEGDAALVRYDKQLLLPTSGAEELSCEVSAPPGSVVVDGSAASKTPPVVTEIFRLAVSPS